MGDPLPTPTNTLLSVVNQVLDFLIKGLGVDFTYAYVVSVWPPAAWPFLGGVIKNLLGAVAGAMDNNAQKFADTLLIRLQNDIKNVLYNAAVVQVSKPGATQDEIASGLASIDKLINENS